MPGRTNGSSTPPPPWRSLPQAHPDLPTPYVTFLERLWTGQNQEAHQTFSWPIVKARYPVFARLLLSDAFARPFLADPVITQRQIIKPIARAYKTEAGAQVVEALANQAVFVPERWASEDKRPEAERQNQLEELRSVAQRFVDLIDRDRTLVAPAEDEPPETCTSHTATGTTAIAGRHRHTIVDIKATPPIPGVLGDIISDPIPARRWTKWTDFEEPPSAWRSARVRLSLYQLADVLNAFDKPLIQAITNIKETRTHRSDDPVASHLGQVNKGWRAIRHAALVLDQAVDHFAPEFHEAGKKLSRDTLVSVFVRLLCADSYNTENMLPQRINRICLRRRRSLAASAHKI